MRAANHAVWSFILVVLAFGIYAIAQQDAPLEVEAKESVDYIIIDKALYERIDQIEGKIDWIMRQFPADNAPDPGAVNINTASYEELQTVPGIGPITAGSIIAERGQGGPFSSWESLMDRVSGVGPATISNIQASGAVLE